VTPRLIATAIVLPLLTIIADFLGLVGGFMIAYFLLKMTPAQYWNSAWQALEYSDLFQGLIKPFAFAFVIALVGCHYGMQTTGGTQGVGRSTTRAMVVASVWIFVLDFFITRFFVGV
jgi:phospholipid/cholesterol/gamma-HCH transport system permease protein